MERVAKQIRRTFLLSYLLDAPLFAMWGMLQFVLIKELGATVLQIAICASVKPVTALVSSYWSSHRVGSIRNHLLILSLLACVSPLLFPFFSTPWFCITAFGLYFVADRAAMTGWVELMRKHVSVEKSSWPISRSQLILFVLSACLPPLVAPGMDGGWLDWRWLFFALGLVSMGRIALLFRFRNIDVDGPREKRRVQGVIPFLLRRPEFAFFQLIFMFGGLGLMMALAVVPLFVSGSLSLTYTEVALAFALAKGVGYACSARVWSTIIHRINIYSFCALVTLLAALSVALIPCALWWTPALPIALFIYGIMQGGSQLGWQLSGPIFSGKEDSTPFASVNVMSVGIRGLFGPSLGIAAAAAFGPVSAFAIGSCMCLFGSCFGLLGYRLWGRAQGEVSG